MSEPVSLQVFDVTASALAAERARLTVIAQNIANAQVTHVPGGGPYRRQQVLFESVADGARRRAKDGLPSGGVRARVVPDPSEFPRVHMPGNPDADAAGYVRLPNVSITDEMVGLIDSARTYESNLSALRTYRKMLDQTIEMAR